jgi:hypothetical protein
VRRAPSLAVTVCTRSPLHYLHTLPYTTYSTCSACIFLFERKRLLPVALLHPHSTSTLLSLLLCVVIPPPVA